MPQKQKSSSGGNKKHGRNKDKCTRYRNMHTREKNKVRRVLRSSGLEEAKRWAKENNVSVYLRKIINDI
ncbi:hypothetical protein HN960_01540 [Candidatus Peregrinibacteria bacterium]|mgnify:CR=1 FL=1|jgi:hypothetical protein|nr:hypothetical protein [Candidatus Peregrinibacteria bacterium]